MSTGTRSAQGEEPPRSRLRLSELLPWVPGPRRGTLRIYADAAGEHEAGVVRIEASRLFGAYLLSKPAPIGHVLKGRQRNYAKGKDYDALKPVLGEGLLRSEGDHWLRQRRRVQPAFGREKVARLAPLMVGWTERMLESWEGIAAGDGRIDVSTEMTRLTLRLVVGGLFGTDLGPAETDRVREAFGFLNRYVDGRMGGLFNLPTSVPTPENLRYKRALDVLDGVVYRIIEERLRRGEGAGDDLLGQLMYARDRLTGERMGDAQLRDEVMTVLLAGHETTANALSWAWHLLSQHPQAQEELHGELARVLGGRAPGFEDLGKLPYTRMVVEETMRLYPPAWMVSRRPLADDVVAGYRIPAGSLVLVSPYVTHRDPDLWDAPEDFVPGRFSAEASAARLEFCYLPFGAGARRCVGEHLATMEMRLVVATVAQRFTFFPLRDRSGERRVEPEPVVTLRPRHGIPLSVQAR